MRKDLAKVFLFKAGLFVFFIAFTPLLFGSGAEASDVRRWRGEWHKTDFSKTSIDFDEIMSGGPSKDGIPAIDNPKFELAASIATLGNDEPVVSIVVNGEARAYPLQILMWHEIVNDQIGEVPVTVTFCPLCNSAIVFDRRLKGAILDFGTTGKLRNSDLVMYDRQTESWWQQFTGEGIVGTHTGESLKMLPSRVESFARFRKRSPKGKVLVPNSTSMRAYGYTPYAGYDSSQLPFLYRGKLPSNIAPLERVVSVGGEAWGLNFLRDRGKIVAKDLVLTWESGQNSALDVERISEGRDIGNVIVQRKTADGLEDVVHDISFAFAFHAFYPNSAIHVE
ncbi:MAG: hypothetical protein COA65_07015 [Rhodospirillaceae bacterium]|nr:MAG: hypothetical protein COA65_07015 [Rhodospirillaceae bacterium]